MKMFFLITVCCLSNMLLNNLLEFNVKMFNLKVKLKLYKTRDRKVFLFEVQTQRTDNKK